MTLMSASTAGVYGAGSHGQSPVWPVLVEIGPILSEDFAQMMRVYDENPVQEFTAYAVHPTLHDPEPPELSTKRMPSI
jgi:hypothetical protein